MTDEDQAEPATNKSRRTFLLLVPLATIGGMFATLAGAAFRLLRPMGSRSGQTWLDVARVAEISGSKPIARKVMVEQTTGWARSQAVRSVYILPARNNRVLSAVCPHEGCEVSWRDDQNIFSCPCHDSNFAADGSPIYGPARRGLDPLPSRVADDKLQVQYQPFTNGTHEGTPSM